MLKKGIINYVFTGLVVALILTSIVSCGRKMSGDAAFEKKMFAKAVKLYSKDLEESNNDTASAHLAYKIAESYRNANRIADAQKWYKESIKYGLNKEAYYYYADMLKRSGKYYQAIDAFNEYIDQEGSDKNKANIAVLGCKLAMEWMNDAADDYDVFPIEALNTEFSDYAPSYNGNNVVFSSHRKKSSGAVVYGWNGEKFSDLFTAPLDGEGMPGEVITFDKNNLINTKYHEGASAFSADTNYIYFTRCGSDKVLETEYCKIFRSKRQSDNSWGPVQLVELYGEHDTFNVGQPCISPDGNYLFFSTDLPGGYGGKDIYFCEKKLGMWSDPINLGAEINTQGDEMYPFMHTDGKLYFCSDGHIGMGGLDIFEAEKKGNEWIIYNMRYPLNSGADDFGLVLKSDELLDESGYYVTRGFFTSTREGGVGGDDIYGFSMTKDAFYFLNVEVYEKILQNENDPSSRVVDYSPLGDATIEIYEDETLVERAASGPDGKIRYKLKPNKEYKVKANKKGFLNKSEYVPPVNYSTEKNKIINVDVELILDKSFKSETFITVNNIYYDFDAYYIREEAAVELDSLSGLLKDNPQLIKIEIGSHTDSRGSYAYNEKLSQKRAESCVKYLLSKGIDATRLEAKGYGESELVNRCHDGVECTEEQHQRNRRTTFKVLMENMEIVSEEPEKIVTDFAPESARGVVEIEDKESVEEMLKKYEQELEDKKVGEQRKEQENQEKKKAAEKESNEFFDSFEEDNVELSDEEKAIEEIESHDEQLKLIGDGNGGIDEDVPVFGEGESDLTPVSDEIEEDNIPVFGEEETSTEDDIPVFGEEETSTEDDIPVFSQNNDGSVDFGDDFMDEEEEKEQATDDASDMLDDFLEGDDASIEDLNKDNVEWDFVEEENDQEIVIKEVQSKSVECVISAKYKEKKEYLFVLTNEDTLIEQIVDKPMFKSFDEGDEVIFESLENGFKIVPK